MTNLTRRRPGIFLFRKENLSIAVAMAVLGGGNGFAVAQTDDGESRGYTLLEEGCGNGAKAC